MLRATLFALALFNASAAARDISGAGPEDGPLTNASPQQIAADFPDHWTLREGVLLSVATGLSCPEILNALALRGTRQDATEAHCVWLDPETRFGVWALSVALDDRELWRGRFQEIYEEGAQIPGNEVLLLQTRRVGDCIIDSYSVHRAERFWMTIHEVWAPRRLHQIRNFTYDQATRGRVDAASERVLALSESSLCGPIS